jgi:hypothetical protein
MDFTRRITLIDVSLHRGGQARREFLMDALPRLGITRIYLDNEAIILNDQIMSDAKRQCVAQPQWVICARNAMRRPSRKRAALPSAERAPDSSARSIIRLPCFITSVIGGRRPRLSRAGTVVARSRVARRV